MKFKITHYRRILLVAAFLAFDLICSSKGSAQTLKSHECFQNFSGALARVKDGIPRRFGQAWKMESLPPAIAGELEWIYKTNRELEHASEKLDSRAGSLHADQSELETATNWQKTRTDTLESKEKDFKSRWAALEREIADLEQRRDVHNAHQCVAPHDNPSACAAYEEEARRGNAESARLEQRQTGLTREHEEIKKQGEDLFNEAAQLAITTVSFVFLRGLCG